MTRKVAFLPLLLSMLLLITSCAQGSFTNTNSGISGSDTYEFPDEPEKSSIEQTIQQKSYASAKELVSSTFPLFDNVKGDNNDEARIYVTRQFTIDEVSSIVTEQFKPERESDNKEGKKVLIYPDYFITLQQSEQNEDAVLMEIASDQFVRNNYSPDFFDGLLALWILDEVLDVDDWHKKRKNNCLTGSCYGGYSASKYKAPSQGGIRGSSGTRGGGPSTGK
ncbi:DUF4247 domain-containing protein [Pontibacillus salicampi]|uniref:DUF4247 domain-containing protein n=1 Tax=Pontibacillus salicampi TaxID=1449801 RepID=A0ABV6LIZ2_9BACI